jgi:hypothetical protein
MGSRIWRVDLASWTLGSNHPSKYFYVALIPDGRIGINKKLSLHTSARQSPLAPLHEVIIYTITWKRYADGKKLNSYRMLDSSTGYATAPMLTCGIKKCPI